MVIVNNILQISILRINLFDDQKYHSLYSIKHNKKMLFCANPIRKLFDDQSL